LATSQTLIVGNLFKKKKRERLRRLTVTSALTAGFQDLCLFEAEFLPFLQLWNSWFLLYNHFKRQGSRLAELMVPHG
jgi:hypothetical protein